MMTIIISEGITATLTNKTATDIQTYNAEMSKLERWVDNAFDERDWEDIAYYYQLMEQVENKYSHLFS